MRKKQTNKKSSCHCLIVSLTASTTKGARTCTYKGRRHWDHVTTPWHQWLPVPGLLFWLRIIILRCFMGEFSKQRWLSLSKCEKWRAMFADIWVQTLHRCCRLRVFERLCLDSEVKSVKNVFLSPGPITGGGYLLFKVSTPFVRLSLLWVNVCFYCDLCGDNVLECSTVWPKLFLSEIVVYE